MSDAHEGRISTERQGDLMMIAFDRPHKLNGFTPTMLSQLGEAYDALEKDDTVRCGLLYGKGDNFTAGLDLPTIAPKMAEGEALIPENLVDPFDLRAPKRTKPLVVAVHGWCLTLGIEVMLAADVVVAADTTKFSQLEVGRGLMATGGATIRMVERAGWGNAMRYLLTGDFFDAETALRLNFVQEVVPAGQQFDRAREIAQTIAAQAPMAVKQTIINARLALEKGPVAAAQEMDGVQKVLAASEDVQEGVRAFKERRPGAFKGR